jgi:hypothetical protein
MHNIEVIDRPETGRGSSMSPLWPNSNELAATTISSCRLNLCNSFKGFVYQGDVTLEPYRLSAERTNLLGILRKIVAWTVPSLFGFIWVSRFCGDAKNFIWVSPKNGRIRANYVNPNAALSIFEDFEPPIRIAKSNEVLSGWQIWPLWRRIHDKISDFLW